MSAQPVLISIPPTIRLEKILYATDFSHASERAVPIVSAIARHYNSEVFLAHIRQTKPYPVPGVPSALPGIDEDRARHQMEVLRHRPEFEDLRITTELEWGEPVDRIKHYAERHNIDLVILGTHGRTRVSHALMGSVAEDLFRTLKCALTAGPHLDSRFTITTSIKSILFPTDLSPESKAVFPYLCSLAAEFQCELVILHILPTEAGSNPDARMLAEPIRQQMQRMFSRDLSPRCKPKFVLEFGDVASRILSAAEYYQSDLIGMGVREGSELITHFRSTAAYRVVVGAPCPVLTVRGTL